MDGRRALLLALALAMAVPAVALADTTGAPNVGWGLTPDHPLWKAELFVEWARTAAKRDPLEKAKFEMDIRERRLADAQEMMARGRNDSVAIALANYQEHGASIEQEIASEQARPEFAAVKARLEQHKFQTAQREASIVGGIPLEVRQRLEESDKSIDRASDQAQAKAELAQKAVKDWLRATQINLQSGANLVAVYESLTNAGKVPGGQVKATGDLLIQTSGLHTALEGKTISMVFLRHGEISDTVTGRVQGGQFNSEPNSQPMIVLRANTEDIPAYVGHMMANDKVALGADLLAIGATKEMTSLFK